MDEQSHKYSKKIKYKSHQKQNPPQPSLLLAEKNVQKIIQKNVSKSQTVQKNSKRLQKLNQFNKAVLKKKQIIKKQLSNLSKQIQIKQQILTKVKKQISMKKSQSYQANKQLQQKKKRQFQKQVEKWAQQKHLLQLKRQQKQQKILKNKKQQKQKAQKLQQQKQELAKLQKRKKIQQKIRQIQKKKVQRKQRMHSLPTNISTHATLPKYKLLQLNYCQIEMQKQFQIRRDLKNRQKKNLDFQKLLAHQKKYIQKIKQRQQEKKTKNDDTDNSNKNAKQSNFSLLLNRKDEKIKQQFQKFKKRQNFQEKLDIIHLTVDKKKKIQRQINIDKTQNPYKYMFLGLKALNDQQIYRQFKTFEIKSNTKQIGDNYLKELKNSPKKIRQSKSAVFKKQQTVKNNTPIYKNYLAEMKLKKRPLQNQIQKIKRIYHKNPQLVQQILTQQSIYYQQIAQRKIQQLKNQQCYEDSLKKQAQIDEMFFKSLETRLISFQLL